MLREEFTYDLKALKRAINGRVASGGEAKWSRAKPDGIHALLLPPDGSAGSPILLSVVRDVARLQAGTGARLSLSGAQPGDEERVAEVVGAIIDGGAAEHAIPGLDGEYVLRLEVRGDGFAMTPETRTSLRVRDLPPW